jgi:glutamate-1-semialdehyde 2,1-aminomutase
VGRADVLSVLDYRRQDGALQLPLVTHQGTYNAVPVSAAAGIATLEEVRRGGPIERANRIAAAIRDGINAAIRRRSLGWCAYGEFSDFHLFRGDASPEDIYAGKVSWQALKGAIPLDLVTKIRAGFLLHGVDIAAWPGGLVSAAHTDDDAARTVTAFESTFDMLSAEGAL